MKYQTLVEIHKGIIYLFLLLFFVKFIILLVSKKSLAIFRNKTKILEMILGPLILISGLIVLHGRGWNVPDYVWIKLILFILAIPLAIVSMKKANLPLAIITVLLFISAYMMAKKKKVNFFSHQAKQSEVLVNQNSKCELEALSTNSCTDFHATFRVKNSKENIAPAKLELVAL